MNDQRGFTYLGVLLAVALIGLGLSLASEVWSTTARRQRQVQLEWVGQQYVQAIGSYYESTPGRVKAFPKSIEDLLDDKRVPFARRHLRQPYPNPLSGRLEWELIRTPDGGFRCVGPLRSNDELHSAGPFCYRPDGASRGG
ncbi:type II secretion system protein [Mitsuaria sp. WAJ17]|uniref:type II secretion system protein n=1 Tax=Mitsuaria sp. WAJ17 TaxID=2761452 RepID=UPI0015FEBBD8|nr:type II secretion system protein [Mitsuaria sp. WAJ17]MBB2487004.1 type II secretion system protein [Mitsuaria sp. WAJ17]